MTDEEKGTAVVLALTGWRAFAFCRPPENRPYVSADLWLWDGRTGYWYTFDGAKGEGDRSRYDIESMIQHFSATILREVPVPAWFHGHD